MAASHRGPEIVCIRANLRDLGLSQSATTLVYDDNLACIAMSTNAVRRKYSRHIDIRQHYVRELCVRGVVKLIPLRAGYAWRRFDQELAGANACVST